MQIWRQAFDQIIVAVLIFQLLMIGLVGLKKAPIQAGCLVPLPIITVIFRSASASDGAKLKASIVTLNTNISP